MRKFGYLKNLIEAIPKWERAMAPFRKVRNEHVGLYVGRNYGDGQAMGDKSFSQPNNYLRLAVDIYARSLAAKNPKVQVKTTHKEFQPTAFLLQTATNKAMERMKMRNTLRSMVKDALFRIGIVKVGVNPTSFAELQDSFVAYGAPFADTISFDDFILDMGATRWSRVSAIGDAYYIPADVVAESELFDPKVRVKVAEMTRKRHDAIHGAEGVDRLQQLSRPSDIYPDEVRLMDIFLPMENNGRGLLVTLCDGHDEPLREVDWEGPEHALGPYHVLGFSEVPDNLLPSAPVDAWSEIQKPLNNMMRKILQQAYRQKSLTAFRKGSVADGETIRNARDGDMVGMDDPASTRPIEFGGPNNVNLALMLQLQQDFGYLAGNLDTLGGLSAQADTVGQEQLLSASASKVVADMQDRFIETVEGIIKSLAFHIFYDPAVDEPYRVNLPGNRRVEVELRMTPGNIKGDFLDYNFEIEPYSMAHTGPMQELQQVRATVSELVQMLPLLQEQGLSVDIQSYLRQVASLSGVPVSDLVVGMENPEAMLPAVTDPQSKVRPMIPQNRTVTRINKPAGTRVGRSAAMVQTLLGGNAQGAEAARLGMKG